MKYEENLTKFGIESAFSEKDRELVFLRIWELLKKQTQKYNGCDSTSMAVEKAQDILESIIYTLLTAVNSGMDFRELLTGDIERIFDKGQEILKQKVRTLNEVRIRLLQDMPVVTNVYYDDTMRHLGDFFIGYDINHGAHNIPCDIDYWPLYAVPESLKGISYIERYMYSISLENKFLGFFEADRISCLYKSYIPDYREMLFDLCEPVLNNAIGLAILFKDIKLLNISESQRMELINMVSSCTVDEIKLMVADAMDYICSAMGEYIYTNKHYFLKASEGLACRIYEAARHKDLSGVFVTF